MSACPAPPAATRSGAYSALPHDQAEAALNLARGATVAAAVDAFGVHRSSIYNWFNSDPHFKRAIEEIRRDRNQFDITRHSSTLSTNSGGRES